ncbi:MAG: uroporphyrinogen decarboxylase family protein [Verrucomicrobiota bacterium]
MTPRKRVITALERKIPDRVPWIEGIVGNGIASAVCKEPINVDWSVAPDGFSKMPGNVLAEEQKKVNRLLGKDNINFCAFAPIFAHKMAPADDGSPVLVGDGMIRTRRDFETLFKLPSAETADFVRNAKTFIAHKDEYCAMACVRLGIGATLLSMGLEAFSYAMADDPQLIVDVHDAYADWTAKIVPILEDIGFDAIWAFDDVAFNSGPVFNPNFYRRHILPKERAIVQKFSKPLITHSDGNMTPLLDAWLELGQQAIHPLQPDVMDIHAVKARYGGRVCLVGNISMADLVDKQPADIMAQARERIETIGQGGGYILSSSNSLTDDMKPENILAMRAALRQYGQYNGCISIP